MQEGLKFIDVEIIKSPIVFKKINTEDFSSSGYIAVKSIITPNEKGYISNEINAQLNPVETNTVVINAAVGQGKTHTILDIAKTYYDNDFIVIFAVPYKALIDQYFEDLIKRKIPDFEIIDYRQVEGDSFKREQDLSKISPANASVKPIHLMTVNALLGNPGEDGFVQIQPKIDYINGIATYCTEQNKKVVIIFDEIHDSIHNFNQRLIHNLFRFRSCIHKVFIVSATYNEASKVVIKYIALLTDRKIQILESERVKLEEKQTDLFILLYNKNTYNSEDEEMVGAFKYFLSLDKKINVLSYSKTLAKNIDNPEGKIGKMLRAKYREINLCTGSSKSIFNPKKCNIGTTFTTGINILGNDKVFVIILPTRLSNNNNNQGIFKRGINTLIQSIARIRDKSSIYIITPSPRYLLKYQNSDNQNYVDNVKKLDFFNNIPTNEYYSDINSQKNIIKSYYLRLRRDSESEIEHLAGIQSEEGNQLNYQFPSLDKYILTTGQKILMKFDIFGKDLSVYLFWAAFNDQFMNCRLKGIAVLNELIFKEGEIMKGLQEFIYSKFFEFIPAFGFTAISEYFQMQSDIKCYLALKSAIFSNTVYIVNSQSNKIEIRDNRNLTFEKSLIAIIQLIKKDNDYYNNLFFTNYVKYNFTSSILVDAEYTVKDYLYACFVNSGRIDFVEETTNLERGIISNYKVLHEFLKNLKLNFAKADNNGKEYFENTISSDVLPIEVWREIREAIIFIKENDLIISKEIFSFFQSVNESMPLEKFVKSVYIFFRGTFFKPKFGRVQLPEEANNKRYIIEGEFKPSSDRLINLLFTPELEWLEDNRSLDGYVENITYSEGHPDQNFI